MLWYPLVYVTLATNVRGLRLGMTIYLTSLASDVIVDDCKPYGNEQSIV